MPRLAIDLPVIANRVHIALPLITFAFNALGALVNPWWHIGTALFGILTLIQLYYRYGQKPHAILRNFGILGQFRYILESIGPELRQYFYLSDTEERPFSRTQRAEVYKKAKDVDSTSSFGSLLEFDDTESKLRHSFFPSNHDEVEPFSVTFGEENNVENPYTIHKHLMISAMSFGSLGQNAVTALSKGAKLAGIPMNTGEGGVSPYHLAGGADLIYQMGTAKFGCRNDDSTLNDEQFLKIAQNPQIKMIEIKFSQGAKPGKGGLLPKEKITPEIARIRNVPLDKDVLSPERHRECDTPEDTVKFIKRVQKLAKKPVGIKFCLGSPEEFQTLVQEMKRQKVFPDYIDVDGAEGGTGAAPYAFMDNVGMPLFPALHAVETILKEEKVRHKVKLVCSGKLINPGRQILAMAHGADACYTARGFMFALGCIQALQCNRNTCPVGITTHDPNLQRGLVIDDKAKRVANYVKNCEKDFYQLVAAMGIKNATELGEKHIYEASR